LYIIVERARLYNAAAEQAAIASCGASFSETLRGTLAFYTRERYTAATVLAIDAAAMSCAGYAPPGTRYTSVFLPQLEAAAGCAFAPRGVPAVCRAAEQVPASNVTEQYVANMACLDAALPAIGDSLRGSCTGLDQAVIRQIEGYLQAHVIPRVAAMRAGVAAKVAVHSCALYDAVTVSRLMNDVVSALPPTLHILGGGSSQHLRTAAVLMEMASYVETVARLVARVLTPYEQGLTTVPRVDRLLLQLVVPRLDELTSQFMVAGHLLEVDEENLMGDGDVNSLVAQLFDLFERTHTPLDSFMAIADSVAAYATVDGNASAINEKANVTVAQWIDIASNTLQEVQTTTDAVLAVHQAQGAAYQRSAVGDMAVAVLLGAALVAQLYAGGMIFESEYRRQTLMQRDEMLRGKSAFVRYVGHEGRGPANAALLAAELLAEDLQEELERLQPSGSPAMLAEGDFTPQPRIDAPAAAVVPPAARASSGRADAAADHLMLTNDPAAPWGDSARSTSGRRADPTGDASCAMRLGLGKGDGEAPPPGPATGAAIASISDKLELVATIKDALQQQIHVFTDALDWEKISSGSFTLEMQPVAIVQEVQALLHMLVRNIHVVRERHASCA
jgi:signal transduction histidine kinase